MGASLKLVAFTVSAIVVLFSMPSFLTQLLRPFSSSAPLAAMNVPQGAQLATVAAGCFLGCRAHVQEGFRWEGIDRCKSWLYWWRYRLSELQSSMQRRDRTRRSASSCV